MRVDVIFSGQVQGVGFRYAAREQARLLGVTGSVRNIADGKVHLVAEGDEDRVGDLLTWLKTNFSVRDALVARMPARADAFDFNIEY